MLIKSETQDVDQYDPGDAIKLWMVSKNNLIKVDNSQHEHLDRGAPLHQTSPCLLVYPLPLSIFLFNRNLFYLYRLHHQEDPEGQHLKGKGSSRRQ